MATKSRPYEQFGTYILFRKLESDALGELWRAGSIDGSQLGATVALRRLTGGRRDALVAAAEGARQLVPQLSGTSFVRNQVIDVAGGVPYIVHEYAGGRSLRHIVDRARGGPALTPNPIPIDQAIVVAEKVALSLATTNDLRHGGDRLMHGALIPQFIWISDDGEIRVAGQQLGSGIVVSLADTKVANEIGRYFSPEYQATGIPTKSTDVYSMGAILFLLITGQEPPDAANASAFTHAVGAAKTMSGVPIPEDIRAVLLKSFVLDPAARYGSIAEMKQDLSSLAHGGKYSATTFNLAFYLSSLLKKEMEGEALEREREAKVNITPYLEAPAPAPAPAPAIALPAAAAPAFVPQGDPPKKKNNAAIFAVAAAIVAVAAGSGVVFMSGKKTTAAPQAATQLASALPVAGQQRPKVLADSVVISGGEAAAAPSTATTAPAGNLDPEAQKKAFEEAVRKQLEAEMMKLQSEYNKKLQKEQAKNAPVPSTPAPVQVTAPVEEERPTLSAAQLDAQRREAQRQETLPAAVTQTQAQQPAPALTQTQASAPAPTPAPAQPSIREGDVVDALNLDTAPQVTNAGKPEYPPMAARQRISSTIILTALISETGEVIDVRVLRGDKRFGLEDAAVRALKATRFSPGMKDGKRVKTWLPRTYVFKP